MAGAETKNSKEKLRISCILPALNEENYIATTVGRYTAAIELTGKFSDYEFILVNDGSRDETAAKMEAIASENPHVRVVHHEVNRGLGYSYRENIPSCRYEHVLMGYGFVPHTPETLAKLFAEVGNSQVVLAWVPELQTLKRGFVRHFISRSFNLFLNFIFGLRVKYFNGQGIYPKSELMKIAIHSERSGPHAEVTIKLLSKGLTYKEVGFEVIHPWKRGKTSSSVNLSNFIYVSRMIFYLMIEVKPFFLRKSMVAKSRRIFG